MVHKYLVVPGYVISADGDRHFINCQQLVRAYGVDHRECKMANLDRPTEVAMMEQSGYYIILRPRENGDYSIFENGLEKAVHMARSKNLRHLLGLGWKKWQ